MNDPSSIDDDDATVRTLIGALLTDGLETEAWPRAETSEIFNKIVNRLSGLAAQDLKQKLVVAGFTDYTVEADGIEQPCET